jgi:hypothetical protein
MQFLPDSGQQVMRPVAARLSPFSDPAAQVGVVRQQVFEHRVDMETRLGTAHQRKLARNREGEFPPKPVSIIGKADATSRIGAVLACQPSVDADIKAPDNRRPSHQ